MNIVPRKKVAILLATYNGEAWIRAQLLSILSQEHKDWHVFLRDDGSVDRTLAIANETIPAQQLTVLDNSAGASGSSAANFFSALAQLDLNDVDFICYCDQDDVWSPDKLSKAVDCLLIANAEAYSCDLIAFDNGRRRSWYMEKSQAAVQLDYMFQGASAGCTYVLTSKAAALVKEKTLPLVGAFPRELSHDWLTYAICRSHGLKWYMDQSAHIYYRQHSANAYSALPGLGGLLARLRMVRSGWYRAHVLWLRKFLKCTPEENAIFEAVERGGWRDRFNLIARCRQFRRTEKDARNLAVAILIGIL